MNPEVGGEVEIYDRLGKMSELPVIGTYSVEPWKEKKNLVDVSEVSLSSICLLKHQWVRQVGNIGFFPFKYMEMHQFAEEPGALTSINYSKQG